MGARGASWRRARLRVARGAGAAPPEERLADRVERLEVVLLVWEAAPWAHSKRVETVTAHDLVSTHGSCANLDEKHACVIM